LFVFLLVLVIDAITWAVEVVAVCASCPAVVVEVFALYEVPDISRLDPLAVNTRFLLLVAIIALHLVVARVLVFCATTAVEVDIATLRNVGIVPRRVNLYTTVFTRAHNGVMVFTVEILVVGHLMSCGLVTDIALNEISCVHLVSYLVACFRGAIKWAKLPFNFLANVIISYLDSLETQKVFLLFLLVFCFGVWCFFYLVCITVAD